MVTQPGFTNPLSPVNDKECSDPTANEIKRLQTVRRYDILDTPPDGAYDRITSLAARLFQVPIAIISIVDSDRIWFKSHHGLDANEVRRDAGLCASAILQDGPYIIEDAAVDERALTNPLAAGELDWRFYVAVPLTTIDGFSVGTLCVIDRKPRVVTAAEIENLKDLGSLVMDQLELRLAAMRTGVELINVKASAENADLANTDFISTLVHELRSPLNSILGYAQLLKVMTPPLAPPYLAHIEQIIKAGWHQAKLINDLLDQAVIKSGKLSLSQESLSLCEILYECQAMMKSQAQIKNIHLSLSRNDNPIFVYTDRTKLKQILINLISNAIKYNRPGGTVTIECQRNDKQWVRVNVKDSGHGLSPEKLEQLFQAYNRLGQENGPEEGTGIGLTVTKRLIEMLGGNIGVESTVGVGSIFWIELESAEES